MQTERFPYRCPVYSCKNSYHYFRTEQGLKIHLEIVHKRSLKKNGLKKLIQDSKDWAKASHNLWGR
jgi:hypothetical protein